jgi:hypothetical protein
MKKEKFSELLMVLGEIFDKSLSAGLIMIYFDALKIYTDEQIERAIKTASLTCKFFPKPSELLEFINGNSTDRGVLAWEKFYRALGRVGTYQSVIFDDPVIHSAIELMGGWIEAGKWLMDEMKWKQKEFLSLYPVMARKREHPEHLAGIIEMGNNRKGLVDHIPQPVFIGERKELSKPILELEERG